MSFIDKYRAYREGSGLMWRAGPICEVLTEGYGVPVSPPCYHAFRKRVKSAREVEDGRLCAKIAAFYAENYRCYGVRKMWPPC